MRISKHKADNNSTRQGRSKVVRIRDFRKKRVRVSKQVEAWIRSNRPKKRGDCEGGLRPCPYVSCKYNLYLDVKPNGNVIFNFPNKEVWEMGASCVLDLASCGGLMHKEIGVVMNLSGERIRHIEISALEKAEREIVENYPELVEACEKGFYPHKE